MTQLRVNVLKNVKKIVVKIGTSVITGEGGMLNQRRIESIVSQICQVRDKGIDVIIVSSGAIAAGMGILSLKSRPTSISHKQAAAAIGQIQLMKLYDYFFKVNGKKIAQVLLTRDDFRDKKRYLNAKATLSTILEYKVIPIINENDTIAIDEIKFGDNDNLSGLVAKLVDAGLLLILSDVDGLWDGNKNVINTVRRITPEIEKLAKGTTKEVSTGGMITKLEAAKAVTKEGIMCVIANGHIKNIVSKVLSAETVGTFFYKNG